MSNDIDQKEARLQRLSARSNTSDISNQHGYSNFVRVMRIALPLMALIVIFILVLGSDTEESLVTPMEEEKAALKGQDILQNELINPKFESMDKKSQPYFITADRAVQGSKNKELIMLEKPKGHMIMDNGDQVFIYSNAGAYKQDSERFFLQGEVQLENNQGYVLSSEEAHIDLKENFVWSEKDVQGHGPDINIQATGVRANGKTGEVVFSGPAKLILENGMVGVQK